MPHAQFSTAQVVRSPDKYRKEFPASDRLEIVKGDVTDVASLEAAFDGVDNVIFTASGSGYWSAPTVDFQVTCSSTGPTREPPLIFEDLPCTFA